MHGLYNGFGLQTLTKHAAHGNDPSFWGNQVREEFRTYELRGEFLIANRWKTYIVLPFIQNSQYINNIERYTVAGIGDPLLLQGFQVFDPTIPRNKEEISQRLELGIGLKAPLGKIDKIIGNLRPNLDLQPGSGSWDMLSYFKYIFKYKDCGFMVNGNYKVNAKNKSGYKYGNVFNSTLNLFYQTELRSFSFIPMIGMNFEQGNHDSSSEVHFDTGGYAIFVQGGLQLFWKQFKLFGEYLRAVCNELNGYTQLINKHKINVGLTYNF
jgi:hypothetical protein